MILDYARFALWLWLAGSLVIPCKVLALPLHQSDTRPNILLIVADDLGYSDLGAFGGEIQTPNLDKLGLSGVRLSNFYAAPTCSPARSMLMSGTDSHIAGLGEMAEFSTPETKRKPGYEGYLNHRVYSVAELLKNSGYHTYMTGKWHLGYEESQSPAARGFDRSFALLEGGASHFDATGPTSQQQVVHFREGFELTGIPEDFYSSEFYASKIIEYIDSVEDDAPFFAYLAFTAPHWPLQAPDQDIEKYRGKYDSGYNLLRKQRFEGLKKAGLIPQQDTLPEPGLDFPLWESLSAEQKRISARKMEVYAGMVDNMDRQIGRVIQYLKSNGKYDNTIVIFMSDNGADGMPIETMPIFSQWLTRFDNSYQNMGRKNSFISYGQSWALASSAAFRLFKGFTSEGGIRVPAFVSGGAIGNRGAISDSFATVMDIAPTLLEYAGIDADDYRGENARRAPLKGESMVALLEGRSSQVHDE
jgi:arylsulfatase